jgi:hypothetical protein
MLESKGLGAIYGAKMTDYNYEHVPETQVNVPTEDGTTTVSLAWMYKNKKYNGEWVVYVSKFQEGNPQQCKSCIFRHDGLHLTPSRMQEIVEYLAKGTQHECHSDRQYACRGGRDIQLRVFCAMGAIAEPSDAALREANQQFLEG